MQKQLLIYLIAFLFVNCSNSEKNCNDPLQIYDTEIVMIIVDSLTSESIISSVGGRYLPDSVDLIESNGQRPINLLIRPNGNISFVLDANLNQDSIGLSLSKTYYLYFNDSNNLAMPIDIDTIQLYYTIKSAECNIQKISHFTAYYNTIEYNNNSELPAFLIFKK